MILANNPLPLKSRLKELVIDYLVIVAYLVVLFGITMLVYALIFAGIPKMSEFQSQLITTLTSVVPIILIFSYLDYAKGGSLGKTKAGLKLVYSKRSFLASLVRNCVKFLPWQLGHVSTIRGIYTNYDSTSIWISFVSLALLATLLLMTALRKDKRHLGDLLAGTQVQNL